MWHLKSQLRFAADHMDKEKNLLDQNSGHMKQKLSFFATMSSNMFRGEKVMPLIPRTLYPPSAKVVVTLCCGVVLLPVD